MSILTGVEQRQTLRYKMSGRAKDVPARSLSLPAAIICWLGIPLSMAALAMLSPAIAFSSTAVLVIPIIVLRHFSRRGGDPETLIWTFSATATIGLAAVSAVQLILTKLLAYLFLGSEANAFFEEFTRSDVTSLSTVELQKRSAMAHSKQYLAFLAVFSFVVPGLVEELMKYLTILIVRYRWKGLTDREFLQIAIVATLGFSTVENIGFLYAAKDENILKLILTLSERVVIGSPAHALSGCLTACKMFRRDVRGESQPIWRVLGPAVAYHGCFDFALFVVSAADGHVGWVHPTKGSSLAIALFAAISIIVTSAMHLRRELNVLRLHL